MSQNRIWSRDGLRIAANGGSWKAKRKIRPPASTSEVEAHNLRLLHDLRKSPAISIRRQPPLLLSRPTILADGGGNRENTVPVRQILPGHRPPGPRPHRQCRAPRQPVSPPPSPPATGATPPIPRQGSNARPSPLPYIPIAAAHQHRLPARPLFQHPPSLSPPAPLYRVLHPSLSRNDVPSRSASVGWIGWGSRTLKAAVFREESQRLLSFSRRPDSHSGC